MPASDQPDTEAAPTAAAEPLTAELPPAKRPAAELAWSADDETEPEQTAHHSLLVWSALVALVVAIVGALVFLGTTYFASHDSRPVEPSARPPAPVAAPPAPPTVVVGAPLPSSTVTAPPPPSSLTPEEKDARFLALIEPEHLAPRLMDRITEAARDQCRKFAEGEETKATALRRILLNATDLSIDQGTAYIDDAVSIYCPQYGND
jgi:hypothetical protein